MDIPPPVRTLAEVDAILDGPGSPFETEEKVIKGRKLKVYKYAADSVRDWWISTEAFNDREYIIYERERYTYRDVHARVAHYASLLHARGVKKGDRVAIAMRNLPEWIFTWFAAHRLGAVVVAVNCWQTLDALMHCITLVTPTVLLVDEERAKVLTGRVAELRKKGMKSGFVVRSKGSYDGFEPLESALEKHRLRDVPEVAIAPDDPATIFFTSGTTSMPKGVLSTQRQFIANHWNTSVVAARMLLRRGEDLVPPDPDAPQKAYLLTVPLFHAMGNHSTLQIYTIFGSKFVLLHHFDAVQAVKVLRDEGITSSGGVPNQVRQMLDVLSRDPKGWEGIKLESLGYGGGPSSSQLPLELQKKMPKGMPGAMQGYGLTETNSLAVGVVGEDYYRRPSSIGRPPPAIQIKIISPSAPQPASAARALSVREVGEICIQGVDVAEGYYGDQKATEAAFDREGWFRSGDLGYVDEEGFVYLVDRAKDIIIRSGENISSVAVENALLLHPAVKEVAVVPVPCEVHGEQVAAVVVLHPPSHPSRSSSPSSTVDDSSLRALAAEHLPRHTLPALVLFPAQYNKEGGEGLPKNATGKVLKNEVKKLAREEWEKRGLGKRVEAKL
ncbi:hypothetical protein JCM8097_009375 [Rhodosporidiobolus ruineniae]